MEEPVLQARHGHLIHYYRETPPDRRPQDPTGDGAGWSFELQEHGGEYGDNMPQAIRATDPEGRSCTYVPTREDGRVVDSLYFEVVKDEQE